MHFKINTWINHSFIFNCFLFFLVFFFYYLACVFSHTLSSLASLSSLSRLWAFTLRPKWINEAHTKISTHVFIVWCEKKKKKYQKRQSHGPTEKKKYSKWNGKKRPWHFSTLFSVATLLFKFCYKHRYSVEDVSQFKITFNFNLSTRESEYKNHDFDNHLWEMCRAWMT